MTKLVELLGDLLIVAGKKLGVSVDELLRTAPLAGLESMLIDLLGGSDTDDDDPTPVEMIAACVAWVIRHQLFGEHSRDIAYDFMRLKLDEAEVPWPRPQEEAHEIEVKLQALEQDAISEARFADWVCLRVATA